MRRMDNSSSGKEDNTWIKPDMPLCGARMCKEKDENIIIQIKKKLHKVDNSSMVGQQWDKTRSCSWSSPGRRHDGQRKPLRSTTRAQMRERRAAQFSNCFLTSNCQNIQTQSFLEQSVPQKWLQWEVCAWRCTLCLYKIYFVNCVDKVKFQNVFCVYQKNLR